MSLLTAILKAFFNVADPFEPDPERVFTFWKFLYLESVVGVGCCCLRMIDHEPVNAHPGVNITFDLHRQWFFQLEWSQLDGLSGLAWSNQRRGSAIQNWICVNVVSSWANLFNNHLLIVSHSHRVRAEPAVLQTDLQRFALALR